MNRYLNVGCFLLVLLCDPIIACPPTPLPWVIDDPSNGSNPVYSANISCEGEATTSDNYTLKVIRTSNASVLKTVDDTSSQCAWQEDIPEPNGGWPVPGNGVTTPASLELWQGGISKDTEPIGLKP